MKDTDYLVQHTAMNGLIQSIECLTLEAAPNTEYETHAHHDAFEIYWFLDGDLCFAFEGERIAIAPGDMIILSNRQLHRPIIKSICRYHRKRILFHTEVFVSLEASGLPLCNKLQSIKLIKLNQKEIQNAQLDKLFSEVEQGIQNPTPYDEFRALISLFYLLIRATQLCKYNDISKASMRTGKAYAMIQYIDEHIAADLNYKAIAKKFYLSEKNLYKVFKQETGFPLGKYIKERRIIKAKAVLNAGGSASDAAAAAGFQDYSVFYRNFLRETGMTPAKYTKSFKIKP